MPEVLDAAEDKDTPSVAPREIDPPDEALGLFGGREGEAPCFADANSPAALLKLLGGSSVALERMGPLVDATRPDLKQAFVAQDELDAKLRQSTRERSFRLELQSLAGKEHLTADPYPISEELLAFILRAEEAPLPLDADKSLENIPLVKAPTGQVLAIFLQKDGNFEYLDLYTEIAARV